MSLSSCHCKHRPAFVCIRSLCKQWGMWGSPSEGSTGQGFVWKGGERIWVIFIPGNWWAFEMSGWHCSPSRLLAGSSKGLCHYTVCTAAFITVQTWWLSRASDQFSLILATETAPSTGAQGNTKVVAEEISPFKRKNKNLGKTFLLPPHFSWAHTGAVGGSKSSSAPQEQGYCRVIFLKLHQGREAGAGNWACGGQRISQHGHCQEDPGCRALLQLIFAAWRRRRIPQKDSSTLASGC